MIEILKNPITYFLLGELIIIGINYWNIRVNKETDSKIKKRTLIASLLLAVLIIGQGYIQIKEASYQKTEISDVEVKIEFSINPFEIEAITTKQEFSPYLNRINVLRNPLLRKIEIYKSEILHEILRDWSIYISTNPHTGFNANYIDEISDFKFKEISAGIYSNHVFCEITYILNSKRDLDLSNLKELNENFLNISIISNPLISDLLIENISIELNTKNAPIESDLKLNFSTGLKDVIPQENNALEKIGLDSISTLINQPKITNEYPIGVNINRGDGLWVWRIERKFTKNEY